MILVKIVGPYGIENHRVTDFPCRLGRAVDNEIVISHPSVSWHHAVLGRDESGFFIQDTGSTNGLRVGGKSLTRLGLQRPVDLKLGDILVHLRSSDEAPEATAVADLSALHLQESMKEHPALLTLGALLLTALLFYLKEKFMEPTFQASVYAGKEIGAFAFYLIPGAALAMWSKFQTHRYNFMRICFVLIISVALLRFFIATEDFVEFNLNSEWMTMTWQIASGAGVLFFLMNEIAKVIFPEARKNRRYATVIAILLALHGLFYGLYKIAEDKMDLLRLPLAVSYPLRSFTEEKNGFENLEKRINSLEKDVEEQRAELAKKNAEAEL